MYVSNLNYDTTPQSLRDYFQTAGQVVDATILKVPVRSHLLLTLPAACVCAKEEKNEAKSFDITMVISYQLTGNVESM